MKKSELYAIHTIYLIRLYLNDTRESRAAKHKNSSSKRWWVSVWVCASERPSEQERESALYLPKSGSYFVKLLEGLSDWHSSTKFSVAILTPITRDYIQTLGIEDAQRHQKCGLFYFSSAKTFWNFVVFFSTRLANVQTYNKTMKWTFHHRLTLNLEIKI